MSSSETLDWMLGRREEDVVDLLAEFGQLRPELLQHAAAEDDGEWQRQAPPRQAPRRDSRWERALAWLAQAQEADVLTLFRSFVEFRPGVLLQAAGMLGLRPIPAPFPMGGLMGPAHTRAFTALVNSRPGPAAQGNCPCAGLNPAGGLGAFNGLGLPGQAVLGEDPFSTLPGMPEGSNEMPTVQFSTSVFYCNEDEQQMKMDVMRIGNLQTVSHVEFSTRDSSAKAGLHYVETKGTLTFEKGETDKTICVPMVEDDQWSPTLEFQVDLLDKGSRSCMLGYYLKSARVKVIDNDCFPSSLYRDNIEAFRVHAIPRVGLFIEYFWLNFHNRIVNQRTKKIFMVDQLPNLYNFFKLFVNVYLVDFILNPKCPEEHLLFHEYLKGKETSLLLVIAVNIVPFVGLHCMDHHKMATLGVAPQSLSTIQSGLLRKFLNYSQASRMDLRNGDLIMAMTRDCSQLVLMGYCNVVLLVKSLGGLAFFLIYQFTAPYVFHKPFNPIAMMPIFVIPMLMLCFLSLRTDITNLALLKKQEKLDDLVNYVDETVTNFRLIADYSQRDATVDNFDDLIKTYNAANREVVMIVNNNVYFTQWLMILFVSVIQFVGGTKIIDGEQTLGMFLANINIIQGIGAAWGMIYTICLHITETFPALQRITTFMNMPLDVPDRKKLNRRRRDSTTILRKRYLSSPDTNVPPRLPVDRMQICIGNLNFTHKSTPKGGVKADNRVTQLQNRGVLELTQGNFVCLVGPSAGGKTTLLKILGGEILPDPDSLSPHIGEKGSQFFVPAHLRVLHVHGPMFKHGSMLDNLRYGTKEDGPDGQKERVKEILSLMGAADSILEHIEKDDVYLWPEVLSQTQCQLINLARAFVYNPEVLCVHKPTLHFDEGMTMDIGQVMRQFVDHRGVAMDLSMLKKRRPRTLVITTASLVIMDQADMVFKITRDAMHALRKEDYNDFLRPEEDAEGHY